MVIHKEGDLSIILDENTSLEKFLEDLTRAHAQLKHDNLIVNLTAFVNLEASEAIKFRELSDKHRSGNKSFVLVSKKVSYDELPEELLVVPTIQEARDLIEMEDIERDLGL